jgi:ribose transport system substrate-binding protein
MTYAGTASGLKVSRWRVTMFVCLVFLNGNGCRSTSPPTIAFIPQTSGTTLWEAAHAGAEVAARSTQVKVYWNAPTREDDVQGQIALVERVIDRKYQGIVLAPDQALALITPVRRALTKGIPTVIIGSPLPIPPSGKLSYILNDEEEGGQLAASRIAELLHGSGSIAVLGINPDIAGIMTRARSLESALARNYPKITIIEKHMGSFNVPKDQQVAEESVRRNPDLNGIVALTGASTRAAYTALSRSHSNRHVDLVGFDAPDAVSLLTEPYLDSVIIENSREMGLQAINTIAAQLRGQLVKAEVKLKPVLVTRDNLNSPEVRQMISMEWRSLQ